jgi:ubiquitin carboxyl-terminal hydrolase 14
MDLATDELKAKLLPVNRRLLELQKERAERRKIRSRTKVAASSSHATASTNKDVEMTDANNATASTSAPEVKVPDELEDEHVYREREQAELEALVHPDMKQDAGCSVSGLYELVGRCRWSYDSNAVNCRLAIVTHKGPAADAGHYIGFVKKRAFRDIILEKILDDPHTIAQRTYEYENDEDWYKFDDDKVSIFPVEKLLTLDGGGTSCQIVDMRHLNPLSRRGFVGICTIV